MNKIFFIILIFKNILANEDESNEKYIDLLPEEEKQEFLNRIARRILEGIKSSDTPNDSHADITDDQLDAHNTYVKDILKEESENLKSEKRLQGSDNKEEFNMYQLNNDNKDQHIDLTLNEGRRQKKTNSQYSIERETTTEFSYDVIPVEIVYDPYENNNDVNNSTATNLMILKDNETSISDHEINTMNENKESLIDPENPITAVSDTLPINNLNSDTLNKTEDQGSLRKSYNNHKIDTTVITDFEPNSNEYLYTNGDNDNNHITPTPVSKEIINNTTSDEGTWGSTQKIYVEGSGDDKSDIDETTQMYQNTTNNETLQMESSQWITNSVDITETSTSNSTMALIAENATNAESHKNAHHEHKNKFLRSGSISEKDVQTEITSSIMKLSTVTTDYSFEPMDKGTHSVTEENTFTKNISSSMKPDDLIGAKLNTEKNIVQTKSDQREIILRARPDIIGVTEIDDNNPFDNVHEDLKKVNVYEVYEVDANKPQFLYANKAQYNAHPYYVPVYNYSPDNAYFKPYNRYGPNVDDMENNTKSNIIFTDLTKNVKFSLTNGRNRFSGYNKKNEIRLDKNIRNANKQMNKKQNIKLFEFMKPMKNLLNTNIYYNPNDYLDIDYYIGRVLRRDDLNEDAYDEDNENDNKHFPNSDDPDHPLSSIHKSNTVKDHVRAIRKILYLQKLFGYVPNNNDQVVRKANLNIQKGRSSKKPNQDNIAIDYYFDRVDSNEQGPNNRLFSISELENKHANPNIVPITPIPLNFRLIFKNKSKKRENLQKDIRRNKKINQDEDGSIFSDLLEAMFVVLDDMITFDNSVLVKYDWLKTTVNIQAGVRKLLYLIEKLQNVEFVHPKDIELLKYTLYLFKSSKLSMERESKNKNSDRIINTEIQRAKTSINRKSILPNTKPKIQIKQPLKLWKEFTTYTRNSHEGSKQKRFQLLYDFEGFLENLLLNLNDFHDAIKHIALITKFKNQRWLPDLKDIFLQKANKKRLAQVILHISLSRFLDMVEESATNGAEEDFRSHLKNNRVFVRKSIEECIFILKVLELLHRINISE